MFGYFQNAGKTLRQGIEAKINYKRGPLERLCKLHLRRCDLPATSSTISSPNNPAADANGNIFVTPGDHIPAIPAHRFKAGAEYAITDAWKFGADLNVIGSQ